MAFLIRIEKNQDYEWESSELAMNEEVHGDRVSFWI